MPSIQSILSQLLTVDVLIALLVGVVGGIVIGALPGLSATMGVTLLIPITFGMEPIPALVMLTAVYTSAIYGGSITAVLISTPGTPSSACTALDGFELTKQGKGMLGVGISTIASMTGGTFSGIALLTIAPLLAKFALKCSALEYFLLGIFGLCIIGGLTEGNEAKGLISGLFGLLIGFVGLDPVYGAPRFTFGIMHLESGVRLAPAMIGIYAISQVLISAEEMASGRSTIVNDPREAMKGSILPNRKELKQITPAIIKGSIIGTIVGIIPAAGGNVGAWMAYKTVKNGSKHPEEFGHGSIEGVAASESSNNGVTGGALVPLLTLGIPGSGVAAILMGGLMIHGLTPGAELFTAKAHITYPIIIGFIVANILMGIIGLCIARQVAKVALIPMSILCPIIVALATIGAYASYSSFYDVICMAVGGFVGYLMRKHDFMSAPMALGLCLSALIEANWKRATVLSRGNMLNYFFHRPIAVALAIIVIVTLAIPYIQKAVRKAKHAKDTTK